MWFISDSDKVRNGGRYNKTYRREGGYLLEVSALPLKLFSKDKYIGQCNITNTLPLTI